jgi:predicted GNAT family acetyltransferase
MINIHIASKLDPDTKIQIWKFLLKDDIINLNMLNMLEASEHCTDYTWYISLQDAAITAAAVLTGTGNVLVYGASNSCRHIGVKLQQKLSSVKYISGLEDAVSELLDGLNYEAQLYSSYETVYMYTTKIPAPLVNFRNAKMHELKKIIELQRKFEFELQVLGYSPGRPSSSKQITDDIAHGRVVVVEHQDNIVFKLHITPSLSKTSALGVYINSAYMLPDFRDTGLSINAMTSIGSEILNFCPAIMWFANKENVRAINCYNALPNIMTRGTFRFVNLI